MSPQGSEVMKTHDAMRSNKGFRAHGSWPRVLKHQAFIELEFRAGWGCVKQELILPLAFVNALIRQMW